MRAVLVAVDFFACGAGDDGGFGLPNTFGCGDFSWGRKRYHPRGGRAELVAVALGKAIGVLTSL